MIKAIFFLWLAATIVLAIEVARDGTGLGLMVDRWISGKR